MNSANLRLAVLVAVLGFGGTSVGAVTAYQINGASFIDRRLEPQAGPDPFIVKAHILLSRCSTPHGVIDGGDGANLRRAVEQFRR